MSHIHFPCAAIYAENIKSMGEESWRIDSVGHPGIENIKKLSLIKRPDLFKTLNLNIRKKTLLVTLHSTTLNSLEKEKKESGIFFKVLREFTNHNVVITYPNSDQNGNVIIEEIKKIERLPNVKIFKNLGSLRYLSLMKECDLALGNSSSSFVEAPFLKIPVIDYGERQKGRLKAENILQIPAEEHPLRNAIQKALHDSTFLMRVKKTKSLYGEGNTSREMVKVIQKTQFNQTLFQKRFVKQADR
jgi:UDP-hydrolysing UDP-N-acetyl-D-glucosamine 2-epimerase